MVSGERKKGGSAGNEKMLHTSQKYRHTKQIQYAHTLGVMNLTLVPAKKVEALSGRVFVRVEAEGGPHRDGGPQRPRAPTGHSAVMPP